MAEDAIQLAQAVLLNQTGFDQTDFSIPATDAQHDPRQLAAAFDPKQTLQAAGQRLPAAGGRDYTPPSNYHRSSP